MIVFVEMFNPQDRLATPYILRIPLTALNFVVFARSMDISQKGGISSFEEAICQWKPFAVVFKALINLATT